MVALRLWLGLLLAARAQKPLCRERFASRTDEWRDCRVQIGGLAIQGADAFKAAMGPTFEGYLTEVLNSTSGLEFEALPLNFNENFDYVGRNQLDYVYSNPAAYTCMMVEFRIATVASLTNFRKGNALDQFAGVIFSRVESNFSTVDDLRQAHVAAVSISGLGAMQLQQAQLLKMGLNIMTDVKRLTFTKNQNKIVQEVQNGWADVGFVRTDMIDRSVDKNATRWEYFKVIHEVSDGIFPFKRSTGFTPEWPIGALPHVPPSVSEKVGWALMRLDRDSADPLLSAPAVAGSFATWVPPMNYLELLSMLEDIAYYSPEQRKCLRAADVLEAVNCPQGWVKQRAEEAFCPAEQCKAGYQCLCRPCVRLKDPELVLTVSTAPTYWNPSINGTAIAERTEIASACSRMSKCASVSRGQRITWTLLDQISNATRLQINQYQIESVEVLVELEGTWQALTMERVVVDGLHTERYVLNTTMDSIGNWIVQLRINGQQAAISPVVVEVFEPVEQRVYCPAGHRVESDGTCSACPAGARGDIVASGKTGILTPVCLPCEMGSYQDQTGQDSCLRCGVGTITSAEGRANCTRCPLGSSTLDRDGASKCTPCDAGQEATLTASGQTLCRDCPEGRYASEQGSIACLPCPTGSFASAPGSVRCLPCPPGATAPEDGSRTCQPCPRGTYTLPNSTGVQCAACGMGMTTVELGADVASLCVCPAGAFLRPSIGCVTCEDREEWEGLECPGGNDPPLQVEGFWVDVLDETSRSYSVYRCRDALECPAGPLGQCARGREGQACNNCKNGYVGAENGECDECGGLGVIPFLAAGCVFLLALAALVVLVGSDRCQQSLSRLTVLVVFGQVIVAVQALGAIRQLSIVWIEPVRGILHLMKLVTFDFDLLQVSCLFQRDSPIMKFSLQLLAYPGMVLMLLVLVLLFRCTKRIVPFDVVFNINGILLFMLFITLTLTVWLPFQCAANPNGTLYMSSNPGITCWDSSQHWVLVVLAVVGTLCYPVAILAWTTWTTIKYPYRVQSGAGLRLIQRHRFLFERFTVKRYYFGLVLLLRNTAVALIPVIFVVVPVIQLLAMGVVLLLGLALQSRLWPWRTEGSNRADMGSICCLIVVLLGSAPLLEVDASTNPYLLSTVLCIAVLGSLACGLATILHGVYRKLKPKKSFDAFLCHHKQGAGCFCRFLKLMLQKHSDSSVFLDSDNLEDLDTLFDIVRVSCKNLVVILTPEVLKRIWCAGEIVTAHRNRIPIVPVYCDGFSPLSDAELESLGDCWSDQEQHLLATYGITMESIVEAYRCLQSLPYLKFSRVAELADQEKVVLELLSNCKMSKRSLANMAEHTRTAKVLVVGGLSDVEALATCQIVASVIQRKIQEEAIVVRSEEEAASLSGHAVYLVVVLTRGLLMDPIFLKVFTALLEAIQHDTQTEVPCVEFVTINADVRFEFPNQGFYEALDQQQVYLPGLGAEAGPFLAEAYRSLFSVLALPLTPHGSESLLDQQLDEVCWRFRKCGNRASARKASDGVVMEEVVSRLSSATSVSGGAAKSGRVSRRLSNGIQSRTSKGGMVMRGVNSSNSRASFSTHEVSPTMDTPTDSQLHSIADLGLDHVPSSREASPLAAGQLESTSRDEEKGLAGIAADKEPQARKKMLVSL